MYIELIEDEPTPEEELDMPTTIGRCVKCGAKVMSNTDYQELENRQGFLCEPCVDGMCSETPWSGIAHPERATRKALFTDQYHNPKTHPRPRLPGN